MRFEPGPHIAPSDMFQLGVTHHKEMKPLAAWHDLTHLRAGNMVDNWAFIRVNNLTDGALKLEVFGPNSLMMPDNNHPLRDMREVQCAFYGTGETPKKLGPHARDPARLSSRAGVVPARGKTF